MPYKLPLTGSSEPAWSRFDRRSPGPTSRSVANAVVVQLKRSTAATCTSHAADANRARAGMPVPRHAYSRAPQRAQQHGDVAARAAAAAPAAAERPAAPDSSAAGAAPQVLAGKTAAVVFGGPAGMLCAAHLARLGASVQVFESRAEAGSPLAGRTIGLGAMAKHSIEAAGLNSDFGAAWHLDGISVHSHGKPPIFFGPVANRPVPANVFAMLTQPGIVAHLRAECERVYGTAVSVMHGTRAVGGNVCDGELVLEGSDGEWQQRQFDMVVGADGVRSAVRRLVQQQDPDLTVDSVDSTLGAVSISMSSAGSPFSYASLLTTAGHHFKLLPPDFTGPLGGSIVSFAPPSKGNPENLGMAGFTVRQGGRRLQLTIAARKEWFWEERSQGELLAAFEAAYPHLPRAWLQEASEAVHEQVQRGQLRVRYPTFITCSKLASGRAVLLGDAAHALSPNIGMGANSALQDSEILSHKCVAAGGEIVAALRQFNAERLTNAHTVTHVSKRIDDASYYKYHKNVFAFLKGLPYLIWLRAGRLPPRVPGFLKPKADIQAIFYTTKDWAQIRSGVRWYMARLLAMLCAVIATAAMLLWKAISFLPL
eukprot:jgi/Ulvmu1/2834/UM143_0006.1